MWLLNTATCELHYSASETEQKYAILSHTWDEEEVLFQDMKTNAARENKGWAKITGACLKAREDNYAYLWVDAVCINKESSAELSEAINSMFMDLWRRCRRGPLGQVLGQHQPISSRRRRE